MAEQIGRTVGGSGRVAIQRGLAGLPLTMPRIVAVPASATAPATATPGWAFALRLGGVGIRRCKCGGCIQVGIAGLCAGFMGRLVATWVAVPAWASATAIGPRFAAAFAIVLARRAFVGARCGQGQWRHGVIRCHTTLGPIATRTTLVALGSFRAVRPFGALVAILADFSRRACALRPVDFLATVSSFASRTTAPAATTTSTPVAASVTAPVTALTRGQRRRRFGGAGVRCRHRGCRCCVAAKEALDPGEEATLVARRWLCGNGCGQRRGRRFRRRFLSHRLGLNHGSRRLGQDALDHRLLLRLALFAACEPDFFFGFIDHLVAGLQVLQARVVLAQALQAVIRRVQVFVRHEQHGDALLEFDLRDFGALLVEQEAGHFHWHLHMHGGRVVLHRLFLHHAQDLQRARLRVADVAGAVAARAGDVRAFAQRRAQALAAQLQQAEFRDRTELHTRPVLAQRVAQAGFHLTPVLRLFHVDEVDNDQAPQVAQAHLARDFVRGLQVRARRGFLDVAAARAARAVHVHRYQCLGVVDHDRAARGQVHGARERGFDLVLDLEAAEQRRVVAVALHLVCGLGHHMAHELMRLLVNVVGVDEDFADV